jgi:cytoskeleton protein RodZ
MSALGETLRRERQRRNLDLETVSRELKISSRMLEAMEDEKFDRLPGGVFAKSFVRQYARFLGLDDEEMAGEVQRILQPAPEVPSLSGIPKSGQAPIDVPRIQSWETLSDRRFEWSSPLPSLALMVIAMLGCAGVYSWWQHSRHATAQVKRPVAAAASGLTTTAQVQPQQPPAAAPPEVQPAAVPAASTDAPAAAQQPAAAPPAASQPTGDSARQETAPVPAGGLPPQLAGNPNALVRVELIADEPVWVLARTDGKYLFSGTLAPNQARTVEANSVILLRLGNAGGVNIRLNGKTIGAVGPKGQVRTVQLTSGGFEIVAAPKPVVPLDPL